MQQVLPPNIDADALPATYTWTGGTSGYWNDPANWDLKQVPNNPEVTVVFRDVGSDNATVKVQTPIVLANMWFDSAKTSFSIEAAPDADESVGLYFSSGQQLANIVLTSGNTANHVVPLMILHSCKKLWGPGWFMKTIPANSLLSSIPNEPSRSKITLSGAIKSYKAAPRASLNLDGYIDLELSGPNSFIGPIDVRRGCLTISSSDSIPVGSTVNVYQPGRIVIAPGVKLTLKELSVDGIKLANGQYPSHTLDPAASGLVATGNSITVDDSLRVGSP